MGLCVFSPIMLAFLPSIKQQMLGDSNFGAAERAKCNKQVVYQSLGGPPLRTLNTQIRRKRRKNCLRDALHRLDDHYQWVRCLKNKLQILGFLSFLA